MLFRSLKIIFLVGDAPPHMDYAGGPKYPKICQQAVKKDLLINTIQCGDMPMTGQIWKEIAQLGEGGYAAIAQSGNMRAIPTPMDTELAELNRKLGRTLVAYGGERTRSFLSAKQAAAEAAPASVAADRLSFNMRSGVAVQGDGELLDGLNQGKLKVESLNRADLPKDLQSLSQKDLEGEIEKRQKDRSEIQARIQSLSKEREAFLAKERARLAEQGKGDSFDEKVASIIREEAARKGI